MPGDLPKIKSEIRFPYTHFCGFPSSSMVLVTKFLHTYSIVSFELFHVPASAPRLVYVLSCLLDGAYKRTLAVNRKE